MPWGVIMGPWGCVVVPVPIPNLLSGIPFPSAGLGVGGRVNPSPFWGGHGWSRVGAGASRAPRWSKAAEEGGKGDQEPPPPPARPQLHSTQYPPSLRTDKLNTLFTARRSLEAGCTPKPPPHPKSTTATRTRLGCLQRAKNKAEKPHLIAKQPLYQQGHPQEGDKNAASHITWKIGRKHLSFLSSFPLPFSSLLSSHQKNL